MLFKEMETFTKWASIKRESETVKIYRRIIQKFIEFTGNKPVDKTCIEDVIEYHEHLIESGYQQSTITIKLAAIRLFFKFLGYSKKIAWDYRLIEFPHYASKSFVPIEPEEARAMIDWIKTSTVKGLRDKTILMFLYATGVRVGELVDLRMNQIDTKNCKAYITSKKNKLKRIILWDKETNQLLKQYLKQRKGNSDHVFVSIRKKTGMTTRSIQRLVCEYRRDKRITTHSFRHGFGVRAVRAGVHIRHIQRLMGHQSIMSTIIYMQVAEKDLEEAYEMMV